MHTRPEVPVELEQDLQSSKVTILYLDGDQAKEIQAIQTPDGINWDNVSLELRPYLVVTNERPSHDPEDPHSVAETTAIPLEDVVEISAHHEEWDESGHFFSPVSRWLRDPTGQLRRFGGE